MDAIRESIKIIFRKQNPERIIQDYFKVKEKSNKDIFKSIYSYGNPLLYNNDEIENVYNLLDSKWKKLDQVIDKDDELKSKKIVLSGPAEFSSLVPFNSRLKFSPASAIIV